MPTLRPFRAVRPQAAMAQAVAALPYDVVNRAQAREIGEANPDSFLHVDRAEMDLDPSVDLYDPSVYEKARENLYRMMEKGILIQDEKPCYYIYELERNGRKQTGLTGCAGIDDYLKGTIRKHELTREDKELDRIRHVDVCDANTGPIYLAAAWPDELKERLHRWQETHAPVYDFVCDDGIAHRVWVIDDDREIRDLEEAFGGLSCFYIADGHHRAASAVKVGLKRRMEHPDYDGSEEFNYFLSVVFPYDELTILAYHRVVKDLNGLETGKFLQAVRFSFELMVLPGFACKPEGKHSFGLYVDGSWYHLAAWPDTYEKQDIVGQLDVSILQEKLLRPILGINDPRTDDRISFIGGNCRLDELARIADQTGGAAFAMYPTSMDDLMAIADEGKLMPPKSTWFEPKLRSGLFIHLLA